MKVLDLFCGPGGASVGYYMAGAQVTGVDASPQKRYPFRLVQADAYLMLRNGSYDSYDLIHASPVCREHSPITKLAGRPGESRVVECQELLEMTGLPWICENVPGSPLRGIKLCGHMFGLKVVRHRVFSSSMLLLQPVHQRHSDVVPMLPHRGWSKNHGRRFADAMGCWWACEREARQCVPPAYTHYILAQIYKEGSINDR